MILKGILFIGLSWLLYWQISNFDPMAWENFTLFSVLPLTIAVALVAVNIGLAFFKWKITLELVAPSTARSTAIQSFFAGLVTGMLTPNMIGNFIGRLYYFDRDKRVPIVLFTLLANYTQFLASLTFGWVAVVMVGDLMFLGESKFALLMLGSGVIVAYLLYFFIDNFLLRFKRRNYFIRFREILQKDRAYRMKLLGLGLLRFIVFTSQFSLVLSAFGEKIDMHAIMAIWQVYLLTMFVPSIVLGKIGVKESISLLVLCGIGMNEFSVLFASLIIWFVNSLSPALLGLIICKRKPIQVAS